MAGNDKAGFICLIQCFHHLLSHSQSPELRTDLSEVSVYGYDYDYTLASYKKGVEYLIHDIAKQHLVR